MSYLSTVIQSAPNLQVTVDQAFNDNNSQTIIENLSLLELLASGANNTGLSQSVSRGSGKKRTVEVTYFPRLSESDVSTGRADCSTGAVEGNGITEYSIDDTTAVNYKVTVSPDDLCDSLGENQEYFADRILAMMDVVERKLATNVAVDVYAIKSNWASNVTVDAQNNLEVDIALASGEYRVQALQEIKRALRKTSFGPVAIVGGEDIYSYYEQGMSGCCSNQGLDVADMMSRHGQVALYDERLATAMGGDQFSMAIGLGSIALLSYFNTGWKGNIARAGANYESILMRSPRTGIPMDVKISDNCEEITISVTANIKAVGLPTDLFPVGDKFDGVRFASAIEAV